LEILFLREWIEHHLALGVDEIHIYDNGLKSVCVHSKKLTDKEFSEGRWGKKINAEYALDLSDKEVMGRLNAIQRSFRNAVFITPWVFGK